jgi:hypothetical protein
LLNILQDYYCLYIIQNVGFALCPPCPQEEKTKQKKQSGLFLSTYEREKIKKLFLGVFFWTGNGHGSQITYIKTL